MKSEWEIWQHQQREARKLAQREMSDAGIIMTCANCDHCIVADNKCGKYGATPPISVVSTGCDEWEIKVPF